jgi:hypothetical protein
MTSQRVCVSSPEFARRRQRPFPRALSLAATVSGLALAACQTPQPLPGASASEPWQKRFQALDCGNPRYDHRLQSTEPFVAAMLTVCRRMPIKRTTSGWQALVILDSRRNEVKAIPISSIYSGGLHFTPQGDVVWYSSGKMGEATRTQKYVEAYALRHGESQERLLGRIEVPFLTGPGVGHIEGQGCRIIWFNSYLPDAKSPRIQQMFLVNDREPFESAKRLDAVGRALFWDPLRHHFVVQKEPYRVLGSSRNARLDRKALDCTGDMRELDAQLNRQLDPVTDENAHYSMSLQGHLAVGWDVSGSHEPEIILFHGDQVPASPHCRATVPATAVNLSTGRSSRGRGRAPASTSWWTPVSIPSRYIALRTCRWSSDG